MSAKLGSDPDSQKNVFIFLRRAGLTLADRPKLQYYGQQQSGPDPGGAIQTGIKVTPYERKQHRA
jgi:hypothetical protein